MSVYGRGKGGEGGLGQGSMKRFLSIWFNCLKTHKSVSLQPRKVAPHSRSHLSTALDSLLPAINLAFHFNSKEGFSRPPASDSPSTSSFNAAISSTSGTPLQNSSSGSHLVSCGQSYTNAIPSTHMMNLVRSSGYARACLPVSGHR